MISFHYTYIVMALGYVLCGYYINLIAITSLILVHELGHYITAKLMGIEAFKIVIYPFGGITRIKGFINRDINSELLVSISGVIYQYIFYILLLILYNKGIIRAYVMDIYREYNYYMIIFNLLPIYPLDGFRIINLLFSKVFKYNLSNKLSLVLSVISGGSFILFNTYNHNYSYFMIISVLGVYNYRFFREIKYIYNRFLLERYMYDIKYNDVKVINSIYDMYKNKRHILKRKCGYIDEKKYLEYYFK